MYRVLLNRAVGAALAALLSGCALHAVTSGGVAVTDTPAVTTPRISERERADLRAYFRTQSKRPRAAQRERLPPGLTRYDTLPNGVRGQPLPSELEVRLPRLPQAYTRVIVGSDVVLIERGSRKVLDIATGVVP